MHASCVRPLCCSLKARRSKQAYERVFREAGLRVVRSEVQLGLPAELFAVHM